MKRIARSLAVTSAVILLTGCSGGSKKVAAHINKDIITEEEFNDRVQSVTAVNLAQALDPSGPRTPGRAGDYAMQALIAERLILQLAAEKKAVPTEPEVVQYVAFAKKYQQNPQATLIPPDPFRTEADWKRDARSTLAYRKIILTSVKVDPAELQKLYDQNRVALKERDQYHLRVIDVKAKAKAERTLEKLKKGLAFEHLAITESEDPVSSAKSGDIGFVTDLGLQQASPAIFEGVKKLKPGEYTPQVITASVPPWRAMPGQPTANETRYFLAQLVEIKTGRTPPLDEVRPLLENKAISDKDPGGFARVQRELRDYQDKARITINLKPYDKLIDNMKRNTLARPSPGGMPTR